VHPTSRSDITPPPLTGGRSLIKSILLVLEDEDGNERTVHGSEVPLPDGDVLTIYYPHPERGLKQKMEGGTTDC